KRGVIAVDGGRYGEDDVLAAIDAGAEDVQEDGELLRILSDPTHLSAVREALQAEGVEIESSDLTMEPRSTVEVKGQEAERLLKLLDVLSELDDVNEVHSNFDIPADVLARLAA
ncbi:MAG TPA: YebC/PmpR family DNA-binding transcriptional regulator, partial [Solirubrobacterales bacterium]|nr:YebC/PmpR family DNA-binding transcriptional regulator [Solirubrobacterales bacterium]